MSLQHPVGIGVGAVDLVEAEDRAQAHLQRLGQHELGLGHDAFFGVDQEDAAVHHAQDALDLAAEVGVAGGVDDVDAGLARLAVPEHRGALGQDGDAALALLVVGVHGALGRRLVGAEDAGLGEQLVDERGLAVVDVGDDGDVAQGHGSGQVLSSKGARLYGNAGRAASPCAPHITCTRDCVTRYPEIVVKSVSDQLQKVRRKSFCAVERLCVAL